MSLAPLTTTGTPSYISTFGDGSDGDVTISTSVSLSRDMYYNSLTITATGILNANGYKIHINDLIKASQYTGQLRILSGGVIHCNGNNASGNTPGASTNAGSLSASAIGVSGGSAAGTSVSASLGGSSGTPGTNSGGTTSGAQGVATPPSAAQGSLHSIYLYPNFMTMTTPSGTAYTFGASAGSGAQGLLTTSSASGSGAGCVWIASKYLDSSFSLTGTIEAIGGNGTTPVTSGQGSSAGSGGGCIILVSLNDPSLMAFTLNVSGGQPGAATGSSTAGTAGLAGNVVCIILP